MRFSLTDNAIVTLAADINNVATTINVTAGQGARLPTTTLGREFMLTLVQGTQVEKVLVTDRAGDVLTVVRGQDGSTPAAFAAATTEAYVSVQASLLERLSFVRRPAVVDLWTDLVEGVALTNASYGGFSLVVSGTGAAGSNVTAWDGDSPGIMQFSTGTTAAGACRLQTHTTAFRLGFGKAVFYARGRIQTLSTSVERFALRLGFMNNFVALPTNGLFFEYDESVSANWRVRSRDNNVDTGTLIDTGIVVAINTTYEMVIIVNAAGTQVRYWLNGTLVATHTTNIPTAAGREVGAGSGIVKSVGTTARTYQLDAQGVRVDMANPRAA